LLDPTGASDETFDATVPISCSLIIGYIIKLWKFPEESTMVEYVDQLGRRFTLLLYD
jgi:predicted permease